MVLKGCKGEVVPQWGNCETLIPSCVHQCPEASISVEFNCDALYLFQHLLEKEGAVSLVRKVANDIDWPTWMAGRGLLDLPESWFDSVGEAAIRVEEFEDDDKLIIRADVPGVNPDEDIEITMTDGMLRIMVQRKKESKQEGKRHYRSELQYGSFVRTIALPAGATDTDVKADYRDGVLEVKIPLNGAQAKTKKVAINRH